MDTLPLLKTGRRSSLIKMKDSRFGHILASHLVLSQLSSIMTIAVMVYELNAWILMRSAEMITPCLFIIRLMLMLSKWKIFRKHSNTTQTLQTMFLTGTKKNAHKFWTTNAKNMWTKLAGSSPKNFLASASFYKMGLRNASPLLRNVFRHSSGTVKKTVLNKDA